MSLTLVACLCALALVAAGELSEIERLAILVPSAESVAATRADAAALPVGSLARADATRARWHAAGLSATVQVSDTLSSRPLALSVTTYDPLTGVRAVLDLAGANAALPFCAFSGSGAVSAPLVYANRAARADFTALLRVIPNAAARLDAVCLARDGLLSRSAKAANAARAGCVALLLYAEDSADVLDCGSVAYDALCPGDPRRVAECTGKDGSFVGLLTPSFPVVPISRANAAAMLAALAGPVPLSANWLGTLRNVSYAVGPGPLVVNVTAVLQTTVVPLANVIGVVPASPVSQHRSEVVLLGAHRGGSASNGADPDVSGWTALMETARTFGALLATGWRPAREIHLCLWDSSESRLAGSTAYVTAQSFLADNLVAYVNVDAAVMGPEFVVRASPSLASLVIAAARDVPYANGSDASVLDWWTGQQVERLGALSDTTGFVDHAGVPALDFSFAAGVHAADRPSVGSINSNELAATAARMWALLALRLAEPPIVPLDVAVYATALQSMFAEVTALADEHRVVVDTEPMRDELDAFALAAARVMASVRATSDAAVSARLNTRVRLFEREFARAALLADRLYFRHAVQAPALSGDPAPELFPLLASAIRANDTAGCRAGIATLTAIVRDVRYFVEHGANVAPSSPKRQTLTSSLLTGLAVGAVAAILLATGAVVWAIHWRDGPVAPPPHARLVTVDDALDGLAAGELDVADERWSDDAI